MISGPVSARLSLAGRLIEEVRNGSRGKVYFIGAGPGDGGLITKRGGELLKTAEVLLYDRLANPALLSEVSDSCQCIPVGKREGEHTASQEEINELLLQKAGEGWRVVRLKGGDPFVFGRGGEEILALEKAGIPYEVIPGVTSAVGALETAGIPVTHRGMARSFHVITGHTAEEGIPDQFAQYAKLEGTLIFLMGIGNLEKITEQLLRYGKEPNTPAAIVEQGTTIRQRRIDGTLGTILETARRERVQAPAVLVVGEVAACHMLSENLPLAQCRIGVTGTAHMVEELEPALRELGAWVYGAPYLRIEPTDALSRRMPDWENIRWLVFTSANGVKQFFEQIHGLQMDVRAFSHMKYAVIGQGTADTLWKYGIKADYMPSGFTVRELAEGLAKELAQGERVCVLRAKEGSADLVKVWKEEKIEYEDIAIYETKVDESIVELLRQQVPVLDYLTFASASGVHGFFADEKESFLKENGFMGTVVCIGRQTKEALTERMQADEQEKIVVAGTHTAEGMIEEILRSGIKSIT